MHAECQGPLNIATHRGFHRPAPFFFDGARLLPTFVSKMAGLHSYSFDVISPG